MTWQDDYGPEYKRLMDAHRTLNDCKKAVVKLGFAFERINHHWVFLVIGDIWGPFITSQRTCDLEEEMHITRWVTRKQVHLDF